jgi:hypothetical protein
MLTIGNAITVGKYSYAGSAGFTYAVRYMYPIDINNDGIKELICAGFESQPTGNNLGHSILTQVNIFGWQDGIFVNITKQWMPDNIGGGIGDVTSGDFNHDGLTDLYLSTYTDTNIRGNPIELLNNGTSFNKVVLPSGIAEHGITSGDVNNDGYTDVLTAGYEEQQSMYLGGPNGLTKTPILGKTWALNGSNVAIGDFLGDGSKSFVVSDSGCGKIFLGTSLFKITKSSSDSVSVDYVSDLPAPLMGDKSHDFRIRTMDFNHDGLDDVIVFSRETFDGTKWPENDRIQFYLNKGNGVFDDVTSTELIGFDTHSNLDYNPIFADFNGDGLIDIFTSESSWEGTSNSTAILMQQPDGTFVDSYRKELSALVKPNGGLSTIMKGPDNAWYLVNEFEHYFGDADLTINKLDFNNHPTGSVNISGTATQYQILTASNSLSDPDGNGAISYQWLRDGIAISNATDSKYHLTQADVGKRISVNASYIDTLKNSEMVSSDPTTKVVNVNDIPTGSVTITGLPAQGQTLTSISTLADIDGLGALKYQWLGNGNTISNATHSKYTLTQTDVGKSINVKVSYVDGYGAAESVSSDPTSSVTNVNDIPTGSVIITGTATEFQTLTVSNNLVDSDGVGSVTYSWLRDGIAISNATQSTYTLTKDDVDKKISVNANYTDGFGAAESAASNSFIPVKFVNHLPNGALTISGNAIKGHLLTVSENLTDSDGMGSVSYQWMNNGIAIPNATHSQYTLTQSDTGQNISVQASYIDNQNTSESVKSNSVLVAANLAPTGSVTIKGVQTYGSTLSVMNTIKDADGIGKLSYAWQNDKGTLSNKPTYTLVDSDIGAKVWAIAP